MLYGPTRQDASMKLSSSRNDRLASMSIGRFVMIMVPGAASTREMGVAFASVVVATEFCGVLKLRLSSSSVGAGDHALAAVPCLHRHAEAVAAEVPQDGRHSLLCGEVT